MIEFLFNPFLFFCFIIPSTLIGIIFSFWKYRNVVKTINKKVLKTAAIAAILVFIEFGIYVIYQISISRRSTAVLGIIEIPFSGIPLAVLTFVITWAASSLIFDKLSSAPSEIAQRATKQRKLVAIIILIVFVVLELTQGYSTTLIAKAKNSQNPDELGRLYTNPWTQYDTRILEEIVRNEKTSDDILNKLALDGRGFIKDGVARNSSTPVSTLRYLYEHHGPLYSNDYVLYSLAVNPSVPLDILLDLSKSDDDIVKNNLASNPALPVEILCQLAKESKGPNLSMGAFAAQRNIHERNIQCPQ